MKKILYLLVLFPILVIGQTASENYIITTTYKVATSSSITAPTVSDAVQQITYFDGLGRPIQKIANQQSASGKNIVTPIEYDAFGRQVKEYLPYASTSASLNYVSSALTDLGTFYNTAVYDNTTNPFSEKQLEASPLNRVLQQAAPGNDWAMANNHTIKFDYQTNTATEVILYTATATWDATKGLYDIALSNANGLNKYAAKELYKTITKDENWKTTDVNNNTTEEFKNKEGKVVLKRTYNNSIKHDTYYVYDQYGNLTFVIPPLVDTSITISKPVLEGLCYQYKYDYRNRLVEKKLPGKQWEFIVYDKLDRIVANGPVLSPFSNLQTVPPATPIVGWIITKYDAFNRPVYTGWVQSTTVTSAGRKTMQTTQNALTTSLNESKTTATTTIDGTITNYSNAVNPKTFKLLTVNYYDDYNYPSAPNVFSTVLSDNSGVVFYNNTTNKPKGLPTGSWVRVPELSTTTPKKAEISYILYDSKARAIRTRTTNYLTGYTQIDTKLDFIGKVLYTETKHKRLSTDVNELFIKDSYTYTNQDRVLAHIHQIGTTLTPGIPQLLSKNTYNELGQLISKNVGGSDVTGATSLQKVDYSYNIRGWMTGINKVDGSPNPLQQGSDPLDLFAFKINYNSVQNEINYMGKELYNGNISETYWRTSSDNVLRKYGYFYDNLNRLNNSVYQKPNAAVKVTNSYDESLSYDKNGNIIALQRNGEYDDPTIAIPTDNLVYQYPSISNQLSKVTDSSNHPSGFEDGINTNDDYSYDANGNMIVDQNKGITSIKYNHLNLPSQITIANKGNIEYLYNALGQKVKKVITDNSVSPVIITTTDYLSSFQYENSVLKFFPQAEGYVSNTVVSNVNTYKYVFNYTDHLGNIRLSYTKKTPTSAISILEENHYYPFGLKHNNYNVKIQNYTPCTFCPPIAEPEIIDVPRNVYQYKYNGKELQDELGLNLYDYGARQYDPAAPHFLQIDPMAEMFESMTPYQYAGNNPVYFIDRNGEYIDINDPNGTDRYRYANGQTQKRQSDGSYKTIDASENLSAFVLNTISELSYLENSGKTGKGLIDTFSGDKKNVEFSYGKVNEAKRGEGSVKGFDLITLDTANLAKTWTTNGYEGTELFVTIGHEMSHLTDPTVIHSPWIRGLPISEGEIRATHVENMIRAESGRPLRTAYGEMSNGSPIPSTTIIDNQGNSVYYNRDGRRYLQPNTPQSGQMQATINDGKKASNGVILNSRYNYNECHD